MRFFARLTCICNLCFIAAVILRFVEVHNMAKGNSNPALKFQPLESTVVVLGYGAILINFIFVLTCLFLVAAKKINRIPKILVLFNIIILPIQIYYFFYSNF